MSIRQLATTVAVLACASLALTACGPDETSGSAAAAPASSAKASTPVQGSAAGSGSGSGSGSAATPAVPAAVQGGEPTPICGNSEKESDLSSELIGLQKDATNRWTAVLKLTNTLGKDCVVYGPAAANVLVGEQYTKIDAGTLGPGTFATDQAHGTVMHPGASTYQPISWLSTPPVAPNASCTTGDMLAVVRNGGVFSADLKVPGARFCPMGNPGTPQVEIGVPQTTLAAAQGMLKYA